MQLIRGIRMTRMKLMASIIIFLCLFSFTYGLTALYNALPSKISIDYREKRSYPIIIKDSPGTSYIYTIKMNGLESQNNGFIRVTLTDKKGHLLSSPFNNEDLTTSLLIIKNNEIIKVREIYVHMEYYRPIEDSKKINVVLEIIPINEEASNSFVTSSFSYGMIYSFDVYANAYLFESEDYSSSHPTSSPIFNPSSYYEENTNIVVNNTRNNTEIINNSMVINKSSSESENGKKQEEVNDRKKEEEIMNNSLSFIKSQNASKEENSFLSITGKAIGGINTTTFIIFIGGVILLYILWKVL